MNAFLEHIALNVSDPKVSFPFYKEFFMYFGYKTFVDKGDHFAMRKAGTPDFWIGATGEKYLAQKFHRKQSGLNHLAFHVDSKDEVDKFYNEFLKPRGIKTLYETPKAFPEYTKDYYAVFFEDPDRIKLEVASFKIAV